MSTLELKIPPVALVFLIGTVMWLVSLACPALSWQFPYQQVIALVLAVAGAVVAVLGVVSFKHAGTTVNPTMPQATSSLVRTGIYRLSRNPMYLGFLLVKICKRRCEGPAPQCW